MRKINYRLILIMVHFHYSTDMIATLPVLHFEFLKLLRGGVILFLEMYMNKCKTNALSELSTLLTNKGELYWTNVTVQMLLLHFNYKVEIHFLVSGLSGYPRVTVYILM